ncbi:MAG TPA: hypothetical protein VJX69_14345, partial [Terriglobales bacterium]|nr:hypothetical protein [Terriglobales bacterium]
ALPTNIYISRLRVPSAEAVPGQIPGFRPPTRFNPFDWNDLRRARCRAVREQPSGAYCPSVGDSERGVFSHRDRHQVETHGWPLSIAPGSLGQGRFRIFKERCVGRSRSDKAARAQRLQYTVRVRTLNG